RDRVLSNEVGKGAQPCAHVRVAMRRGASYSTHLPSRVPVPSSSGRVGTHARPPSVQALGRMRRALAYGSLALGCSGLRGDAPRDHGEPPTGEGTSPSASGGTSGDTSSGAFGGAL